MKKIYAVLSGALLSLILAGTAQANTVTVEFVGLDASGIDVSGFQFLFDTTNYDMPPETINDSPPPNFGKDFSVSYNQSHLYWSVDTLLDNIDTDNGDYVRGIYGADDYYNLYPSFDNQPHDGLFLTMSSVNTKFALDIFNSNNKLYDYTGDYGEVIEGFVYNAVWDGDNQKVIISAIPIPGAVWLLASGLAGLVAMRRKNS
jgi:hypothetical protein